MKLHSLVGSLLSLLFLSCIVSAQSISVSGEIRGTITDSSGAILQKATVTALNTQTGLRRSVMSDTAGEFQITGLPPAAYELSAQHDGFTTGLRKGVVVAVGQTVTADFELKVSSNAVILEVTDGVPVVDAESGSQSDTVTERLIADLPIDRRDFLSYTLLSGGVGSSNTSANNADFRVKQTPQSGLSVYGSNGRGNSVSVDGGEANDDAGGVRLNVSQDSVEEFQINRSNYSAELGGASGAAINIVTKWGTNRVRGSVFGFFRDDVFDARDPFAYNPALALDPTFANFRLDAVGSPVKNSLSRQQFGGALGFPLRKDKTFFFAGYEGLRSDAQDSVPLLTHSGIFAPTASEVPIISALAADAGNSVVPCINPPGGSTVYLPTDICAFALNSLLTIDPRQAGNPFISPAHLANLQFIVKQFEKDGGLFPFPTRQHAFTTRLDHQFNDNNRAYLRYSFAHLTESDPDVQALIGFSRGSSVLNWDSTLQGSWIHQFSANSINEARLQWNIYQFNVDTNDPGGPGLDVQGYGFFGRGIFLPSHTKARRYELADNLTLVRGRHSMRMGFYELIRGNNTNSNTFFAGRFEFLDLPGFVLSNCLTFPSAPIANGGCGLRPASPLAPASLSTLQAWGLGAPAFYEQGFGDPVYVQTRPFTAAYWQDTWQAAHGLTLNYGLRYELDTQSGPLSTYKKNFAPRVSFAWAPFSDRKTVLRGGYGIFYSSIYGQIPNNTRQIANALVTILGAPPGNSAEIYGALFPKLLCGQPPAGANSCITQHDLKPFVPINNSGPLPPGTVLFFGQHGYRSPQAQQASLGIERQIGSGMSVAANYIYVHTTHLPWAVDRNLLPGAPFTTLPSGASFQNWGAPACETTPALCFADASRTILQNNEYASIASAVYHGGILEFKKRFSDRFTMFANYTYSKAIDDSTDFNSDYAAFNELDLSAERSRSDFDQRHKIVVAAVAESPWRNSMLSGFQLSPVLSWNSGHPFNLLAGADVNGDNHFTNDRPPGTPRNSGLGPDYFTFDMRLGRTFRLGEQRSLRFTVEGFNLTNRTNYARVNNIVGSAFGAPFNVHGTATLYPNQPLAFTSALPKRELQLGARFEF
jgi:Carboxypeptidase regulatory-like domain